MWKWNLLPNFTSHGINFASSTFFFHGISMAAVKLRSQIRWEIGFDARSSSSPILFISTSSVFFRLIHLQPQHDSVHPSAVPPLLRPRFILPCLHMSPIVGMRRAAAGMCPPRKIPGIIYVEGGLGGIDKSVERACG